MTDPNSRMVQALEECERVIREVIAAAAKVGDYTAVERGREVAIAVGSMLSRQTEQDLNSAHGSAQRPDAPLATAGQRTKRPRSAKPQGYPRFSIGGNSLIRFGWSKKDKKEYSHKVPRTAYEAVVTAVDRMAANNPGPHTAETITEKTNATAEEPVPNYQVYAILGFLRSTSVIKQQGREGYIIPADFRMRASESWRQGE